MLASGSEGLEKSQDPQVTMAMARQCRIALEGVRLLIQKVSN